MNFKIWIENEASLGAASPEMAPPAVNNDTSTPASDEVRRTGLQPQVDAEDPKADDPDAVLAIDSKLEDLEKDIPEDGGEKIHNFKKLWDKFKEKWDRIKMNDTLPDPSRQGFGDAKNPGYEQMMRSHPNMAPAQDQGPHGPGIFGQV